MRDDYKNKMASKIAARYQDLEERIMQDIVRRIVKTGGITSTADWQINRLRILGYSSEDIEREIKKTLNASYPEMFELYDKVIEKEYVRDNDVYEQINAEYIPFEKNGQLKQITEVIIDQSFEDLENITNSLGFYLDYGNGRKVLTPLAQVYSGYLDAACYDIVTGAFDYNSVLRRVVIQLTNSGLRKIDYSSGRENADQYLPPEEYAKLEDPEEHWTIQTDDQIVLGEYNQEIEKPADLKDVRLRHCKVLSWSDNRFGGLPHWKIEGE